MPRDAGGCRPHTVIKTRWVDTDEEDERSPDVRGRLLAKEVKQRNNTEEESANFIASTPPLETVKFLIWDAMTKRVSRNKLLLKRSFNDVKKAKKCSRRAQRFVEQRSTGNVVRLDVYGDTDRGCLKTRISTTGMVLMHAMHIVSKYQVIRNQQE